MKNKKQYNLNNNYSGLAPKETSKVQYSKRIKDNLVYQIVTKDGLIYIGCTQNLQLRMSAHCTSYRHKNTLNYNSHPKFYDSMAKGYHVEVLKRFTTKREAQLFEGSLIRDQKDHLINTFIPNPPKTPKTPTNPKGQK